MKIQRRSFKQFKQQVIENFPTQKPVIVKRCITPYDKTTTPKLRVFGDCDNKDDCFIIRILKTESLSVQKETLLHEYAHCLAEWKPNEDSHSDEWGIHYARLYRKLIGD